MDCYFNYLLFFLVVCPTSGLPSVVAPLNNSKIDAEPSWVRGPNGRGTAGLMLSCVLTLGLCVWTGGY